MYRTIIFVFVTLTVLLSAAVAKKETPAAVLAARREFSKCFYDIILGDDPNRACKTIDDFKTLANHYVKIEKDESNKTISVNQRMINIFTFSLNHTYILDFIANPECANLTSCSPEPFGNTNLAKPPNKPNNIINMLFLPQDEPKYNARKCDLNRMFLKCVEEKALNKCDNHTAQFVVDLFDYSYSYCDEVPKVVIPLPGSPGGGTSDLTPASLAVILLVTLLSLLR